MEIQKARRRAYDAAREAVIASLEEDGVEWDSSTMRLRLNVEVEVEIVLKPRRYGKP